MSRVEFAPAAARQVERARGSVQIALRGVILGLALDPRPAGARRLVARPDLWRVRVRIDGAPWRIIYQLRDPERLVIVTRVARRDEAAYRWL